MKKILICGEMAAEAATIFQLFAGISGEMQVNDVPLSPGVNLDELKKGDDDPMEVVVEIPASRSKRGWNYTGESLRNIVDAVMGRTLNGFLGHQKAENVSNEFLSPVTHWVGAKMVGETAYFRGVIDSAAKDLKRWIRSKRITQVSIYGMPKLQKVNGETNVVGYDPLSIDWTPLDRAGMNTRIVATSGEMWDLEGQGPTGEMNVAAPLFAKGDRIEVSGTPHGEGQKTGTIMHAVPTVAYIIKFDGMDMPHRWYTQGGTCIDGMTIDNELKKSDTKEPAAGGGGSSKMKMKGEQTVLKLQEVIDLLKEKGIEVNGEMMVGLQRAADISNQAESVLGVTGEMDIAALFKSLKEASEKVAGAGRDQLIGEMLDTKVQSEAVRKEIKDPATTLGKLWSYHARGIADNATKDQIGGEMDAFLADPAVKGLVDLIHTDNPAGTRSSSSQQQQPGSFVRTRSASI
ncbi:MULTISPECIES: hypothetical protein [Paenibacillus]|uniref:hypothetical protein n=1 Tax=Paenibacillus TaxID=44249 RepID=UPI001F31D26F|nr:MULTISPECIES: hypothetical protein [Paenibacillus]